MPEDSITAMAADTEPENLEQLLDRMQERSHGRQKVVVGDLLDAAGRRSFGPVVLLVGMLLVTPLSGIPGIPTLMGLVVLLTLGQILFGRSHVWLPPLLTERQIPRERLVAAIDWMRPWAQRIDQRIRARLTWMVKGPGLYATVALCMAIGAAMPATEVVPFSSSIAGLALTVFGLSLVARDGILAILAWGMSVTTSVMLAGNLL
ncbi:MAG: exopolysaccharide biosynthesis protein [Pseudomonadota bacterium]|nr:exopolysaccharide biosynthesis protein [Pseudomonadota bacterium]